MKKSAFGHRPLLLILLLIIMVGTSSEATEEIGAQEEIDCTVCHVDPDQGGKTLTDPGLYYQYLETLEGYELVLDRFGSCIYCHVDRAGDTALTPQGHRFRWMMDDMAGLRAWFVDVLKVQE